MQAFFSYNDRIKTILEDTTMKVSVIQMNMRSLESKANFDRAEALVRRAVGENGPDVVVLPETLPRRAMKTRKPCALVFPRSRAS